MIRHIKFVPKSAAKSASAVLCRVMYCVQETEGEIPLNGGNVLFPYIHAGVEKWVPMFSSTMSR